MRKGENENNDQPVKVSQPEKKKRNDQMTIQPKTIVDRSHLDKIYTFEQLTD